MKFCLTLGNHEDTNLRAAYMQLLGTSLHQAKHSGGGGPSLISETRRPYIDVLTSSSFATALALCESCPPPEVEEMSILLFRVFEARGSLMGLMEVLIEREVINTSESYNDIRELRIIGHETELFRANSITTRLLTIFAKTYG